MKWGVLIRTLISRFLLIVIILLYAPVFLVIFCLPKKWFQENKLYFMFVHYFYWLVLKASFLPFEFVGLEHIPQEPSIIIANHQSSFDIPVVGYLLHKHPHTWLATTWLKRSLFLRFILPRVAVLVDVSSPLKRMRSLLEIIRYVNGTSQHIVIFPEGGRFTDGKIHNFFPGFVILAKKMGRPVIPIKIFNLNKVYPPHSFLVYKHPVKVVVGPPFIKTDQEDDKAFKERVHQWFVQQQ
jgi:1-acyl-sn-glycerol-3-phosphate acyltransferase